VVVHTITRVCVRACVRTTAVVKAALNPYVSSIRIRVIIVARMFVAETANY
jgi:hypothetical protein